MDKPAENGLGEAKVALDESAEPAGLARLCQATTYTLIDK